MSRVPALLAGLFVFLLCARLVVQILSKEEGPVGADDFLKAREALDSMLINTTAIRRILSDEDLNFVSRTGSNELRRVFLKERKLLVLHWFRMIQRQVSYLMDIHLKLAACASPSPGSELKLSVQYAAFMFVSGCLVVFFWLFGPFNARRMLAYLILLLERFFSIFRTRLESVNPSQLGPSRESLVH